MPKIPRLKILREARALSQSDLAERSGVTQATISNLENGRSVQPRTLKKLAKALRVKPVELLGDGTDTR